MDPNTRHGVPYHVSIGVLCVLDGKDCTPGSDPLHRHPLLSMEFTCASRLKVTYREFSEELVSTFVFSVPMAYPKTTKKQVPHFYPLPTPLLCVLVQVRYFSSRARVLTEGAP